MVEPFPNREIDGVVQTRRVARVGVLFNHRFDEIHVVGRFGQKEHFIIETYDEYAILRAQLFSESDRGLANVGKVKVGRSRSVQEQRYRERFVCRLEICNRLLDAVFKDAKVFALEVGNETALSIQNAYRNRYQGSINSDYVTFADFFRPWRRPGI